MKISAIRGRRPAMLDRVATPTLIDPVQARGMDGGTPDAVAPVGQAKAPPMPFMAQGAGSFGQGRQAGRSEWKHALAGSGFPPALRSGATRPGAPESSASLDQYPTPSCLQYTSTGTRGVRKGERPALADVSRFDCIERRVRDAGRFDSRSSGRARHRLHEFP